MLRHYRSSTVSLRTGATALVGGAALLGAVAGCGSSSSGSSDKPSAPASSSSAPTIKSLSATVAGAKITGLPATLTAGTYKVSATSADTKTPYSLQFVRLAPGYSRAQLLSDVAKGLNAQGQPDTKAVTETYAKATFLGGPAGAGSNTATVFLPSGDYVYVNTDVDGAPTLESLKVTAGDDNPAIPAADITVTAKGDMKDMFTFDVAGSLSQSGTLLFKNSSEDNAHFLIIVKLKPGKTKADVLKFNGDPSDPKAPFTQDLQSTIVSQASSQLLDWKSEGAGTYLLLCFLPDPKTGQPHALEGMVKQISAS